MDHAAHEFPFARWERSAETLAQQCAAYVSNPHKLGLVDHRDAPNAAAWCYLATVAERFADATRPVEPPPGWLDWALPRLLWFGGGAAVVLFCCFVILVCTGGRR